MLSYQHGYHAGNFADVHKHSVLAMLLGYLGESPEPFTVIDLFAGRGLYDLESPEAEKTGEWHGGIGKLWGAPFPDQVSGYAKILKGMNGPRLRRYPGSPAIARGLMRADDRLILNEWHVTEFAHLKAWAKASPRIEGARQDAFIALSGLLPPKIRRGLALLDPSYEVKNEYERVPRAALAARQRWPEGIFLIWYPLLPAGRHKAIGDILVDSGAPVLRSELLMGDGSSPGMYGSGLAVLNPPEGLASSIAAAAPWWSGMGDGGAAHRTDWVKEETKSG